MVIRAVIVGIETYSGALEDVVSPAANALLIAEWALSRGLAPDDIFLFVASATVPGVNPDVAARIQELGLVNRGATQRDIENVLRTDLAGVAQGGIEPGSSLLFYWSGHGMTDAKGQRLLFCADYSQQLADRVFNASLFFRDLRSDEYEGYRTMLALADVCGTNSQMRVRPAEYTPGEAHRRDHLIYFATPEGGYATATTGEGAFTHSALRALKTYGTFPDLKSFEIRLNAELEASGLPRFLVDGRSEVGAWERRYGKAQPSVDQRANSLIELLVDLEVPNAEVARAYRATVWTLGSTRMPPPAGIVGTVRELSAMEGYSDQAPGGLVQYVLRLAEALPDHGDSLNRWLAAYAEIGTVRDERDKIERTRGASLLIIRTDTDKDGRMLAITPRLRNRDGDEPVGPFLDKIDLGEGLGIERAIADTLRQLEADGFTDLEIHFLVDATVLDYPFHQLPWPDDQAQLGESFGVVLHYRERFLKGITPAKRFWFRRATDVSAIPPANLSWTRCRLDQALPTDADLCLVAWLPSSPGKKVLAKLLNIGVPYLYWPLVEEDADVELCLTQTVQRLDSHAVIADAILQRRLAGPQASGSMLWDDIDFKL